MVKSGMGIAAGGGERWGTGLQALDREATKVAKVVGREVGQFALDEARDGASALLTDVFGGTQPRSAHERTAQQRAQARAQQQQAEAEQRQAEAVQALQRQIDGQQQQWQEQVAQRQQGHTSRQQQRDRGYDHDY